jgi:hypothetical protein
MYVTREELDAHLTPMRSDIGEIKRDVKTLLGADAGSRAVSSWQRFWLGTFALAADRRRLVQPRSAHPLGGPMRWNGTPVSPALWRTLYRAKRNGIVNPLIAWQESRRAGISFPLACAILEQESGGGWNVFGHDFVRNPIRGGKVTKARYLAYKHYRQLGLGMQGCGPLQLTWFSYQDRADALGGCWKPRFNMRVGFETLAANVRRYGHWGGIKAYNGAGAAATAYAWSVTRREHRWEAIL